MHIDSHSAVLHVDTDTLIVFGGYVNQSEISNSLHFIGTRNKTWQIMNDQIRGQLPPARVSHAAVMHFDDMYIMGGKNIELNV